MVLLDAPGLRAAVSEPAPGCTNCGHLNCAGWESISAPLGAPLLHAIGTLRDPRIEEPTLDELHTPGTGDPTSPTSYWHAQAPVAVLHFPYNRCTAWRCTACGRGFVQYTEAGGYYVDHRIRAIERALITD